MTGAERVESELERLCRGHAAEFRERFGSGEPPRLFFSPGRVNLFGAHLDYNGGPVMPTAIDRGTFLAVRRRADDKVRIASTLEPSGFEGTLADLPRARLGRWVDYPLGVVALLVQAAGSRATGIEILFGGNLPIGAGLSSSASICVGTAWALDALWELELEHMRKVRAALAAEREFVGVQCGIMDPFAVGLARPGHLLWLDCKDETWEHLPLDFERVAIGVADTGVRRELAEGEFNRRVAECREAFTQLVTHQPSATCLRDIEPATLSEYGHELSSAVRARAQHVVHEVARAFDARDALLAGDVQALGAGMVATHRSLRDHYEVSCPELDTLVDAGAASEAILGGRLTGAGFGGCVVFLIEQGRQAEAAADLTAAFRARFGQAPEVEFFAGDEGPREMKQG